MKPVGLPSPVVLAVACLVLGASAPLWAQSDAPHWSSKGDVFNCTTPCHVLHNASGGALTYHASNPALCQSCHQDDPTNRLPVFNIDKADLINKHGTSHAFDAAVTNPDLATQLPLNNEMLLRVLCPDNPCTGDRAEVGKVVCSTCHDQHSATAATGGRARISPAVQVTGDGPGTMASGGTYTGPAGLWYLTEIDGAGSDSTATFRWSLDNGTSWQATGVSTGGGTPVALGADGVQVTFSGGAGDSFAVGDQWQFSASYPFLRATLDDGANGAVETFCRDCHRSWVMTHTEVRTWDGGPKSHPVGITLGANGEGYDRTVPLDGDGSEQGGVGGGDGNPTNDFQLDSGDRVQCLSCHGVHYADSNTLSVDEP